MSPHWRQTLRVADVWERAKNREISVQDLAKVVYDRSARLEAYHEEDEAGLEMIRDEFLQLSEDEEADFDDFDVVWDDFYDWADHNRVWLQTA